MNSGHGMHAGAFGETSRRPDSAGGDIGSRASGLGKREGEEHSSSADDEPASPRSAAKAAPYLWLTEPEALHAAIML